MGAKSLNWLFSFEAFNLLSNTTIGGTLYGVVLMLYCLCTQSLYPQLQDPDKRQQTRFTLGYISVVLFCATGYLILGLGMNQLLWVRNNKFPGEPIKYAASSNPTPTIYLIAYGTFSMILEGATMAIQIWRLWVIWSGTQYAIIVIVLPVLLLLSYIGLGTLTNILPSSAQPNISDATGIHLGTGYFTVASAFTIFVTGLIIARLLWVRRRHIRVMGMSSTSNTYMSIIAVLIESYALEATWSIATAIAFGLQSPSYSLFVDSDSSVKAIAYFLVVYRVARGRGWTRDTGQKLTSLQWNHAAQTTNNETSHSGADPEVPKTTTVVVDPPPISHSELTV